MVNIDADLQDADWIKQSWPFTDRTLADWEVMPVERLRTLPHLPVWQHAPDDVRQLVERRLAEAQ